jgi:putative ABC transport system permease protein
MPGGGPLPVAASSSFLAASGANIGDVVVVMIEGTLVPIVVRDVVGLFPTMDPGGGGFILAELDPLLEPLNVLNVTGDASPNEVFMAVAPGEARAVKAAVSELVKPTGVVMDRESLLDSVSLDPLVTAGWRAMMLLSLFIAVFTVGLGYAIYLLALATRSRGEMGALQSLGLSRGQMLGLLGLEHLVIAAIGLGLGTWAGFQMSRLMVSAVAVTETGGDVLPPFILTIDWAFLAPIYAVLAIIFLAAIFALSRSMARLKLHTLSRQEV